jgi:cyclically-permuted mutarotase family protein
MFFTVSTYAQKAKGKAMQWKIAAQLPALNGQPKSLGFAGPVAGVHGNILVIAGGANFPDAMPWNGGKKKYYDDIYVYLKNKKSITPYKKMFKLPSAIAYSANCSTPQGIIYAGGESETGISNKAFLLKWDSANETILTKNLPDLPVAVTNAAIVFHNNIVYIAGGETASAASDQFYCLDMNNMAAGWKELPAIPKPVSHTVLIAQSNADHASIYLIGGRKKNTSGISDLYSSVFKFDILKSQWEEKAPLPYALSAGTGIAASNNTILIFGGDKGEIFNKTEKFFAAINSEKDDARKAELIQQKNALQSSHPGFSKEILMYNGELDEWTMAGCIPFDTPVTTTAVKWDDKVIIPGGEIRAGVRTPQILIGSPLSP